MREYFVPAGGEIAFNGLKSLLVVQFFFCLLFVRGKIYLYSFFGVDALLFFAGRLSLKEFMMRVVVVVFLCVSEFGIGSFSFLIFLVEL